jgi:hypothetical protein
MPITLWIVHLRRVRIDRAQRPEERAVAENDRHRNIALQPVLQRRVMADPDRVLAEMIDRDQLVVLADFVADGRFDGQFAAGSETEIDHVEHRAGHPALFRDAGNGHEAHACRRLHHLQDRWNDRDGGDIIDISLKFVNHRRFPSLDKTRTISFLSSLAPSVMPTGHRLINTDAQPWSAYSAACCAASGIRNRGEISDWPKRMAAA